MTTSPATTPAAPSRTLPRSEADERRYNFNMAALCSERGYLNLARHFTLAAGLYQSDEFRAARLARSRGFDPFEVAEIWSRYHPET